jgi:mannitol-1-phosphate/altronate dehydrogenase
VHNFILPALMHLLQEGGRSTDAMATVLASWIVYLNRDADSVEDANAAEVVPAAQRVTNEMNKESVVAFFDIAVPQLTQFPEFCSGVFTKIAAISRDGIEKALSA